MQNNSSSQSFFIRRFMAFLYDSFLLIALFFLVTGIAIGINGGDAIQEMTFTVALYIALYAIAFVFYCWFWRNGGQTLGMQAWRIKVVSNSSEKLTYKQCFLRFLCGSVLFGVSIVSTLFFKSGRGVHDLISDTKIVFINK